MTEIPSVDLGNGAAMPMLGFGTWQLQGELAYEATRHALLIGYRHIDTATMYRNEEQVGRAIADSGVDRADLFVTTKLPPGNAGRARATISESLRSEEHTSELQSPCNLVCRLLLEKKTERWPTSASPPHAGGRGVLQLRLHRTQATPTDALLRRRPHHAPAPLLS